MTSTLKKGAPEDVDTSLINLITSTPNQSSDGTKKSLSPNKSVNKSNGNEVSTSSSSSSTMKDSSYPKMENNATMHQVFFHLSGKNFKVPGSFSFEDKRTIQEWARIWKRSRLDNSEVPVITNDTRTVSLTSKHQPPLIWTMKHLFDWFHLKIESLQPLDKALKRGRVDGQQKTDKKNKKNKPPGYVKKKKTYKEYK